MSHLDEAAVASGLDARRPPPRDRGTIRALVARGPDETRTTPESVELSVEGPLPGDRWKPAKDPERGSQLTAMEHGVGELIANGQPLSLFGDNLIVDLALDADNLPHGSRLRAGSAVLEVTTEPHTGCKKYRARFGVDALKTIPKPERKPQRLRGIHLRVLEPGRIAVGDAIEVAHRP